MLSHEESFFRALGVDFNPRAANSEMKQRAIAIKRGHIRFEKSDYIVTSVLKKIYTRSFLRKQRVV